MPLPTCLDIQTGIGTFRIILSKDTFNRLKQDPCFQFPAMVIELLEKLEGIATTARFKHLNLDHRTHLLTEGLYAALSLSIENPLDGEQIVLEACHMKGSWPWWDESRAEDAAEMVMDDFRAKLKEMIRPAKEPLDSPPYIGDLEPKRLVELVIAFGALTVLPAGAGTDH